MVVLWLQVAQEWRHSKVTINSGLDYKLVFEDVTGAYSKSDKAVDDIFITDGPCHPILACDFETGCGWSEVVYVESFSLFIYCRIE